MERVVSIIKASGFILVVLVGHKTGSITLGLAVGVPVILLGDLVWVRWRITTVGVIEDERERLVRMASYHTAGMIYTITVGLLVTATLILQEWGILELTAYQEGLINGLALSIFALIGIVTLASIYHTRRGGYGV